MYNIIAKKGNIDYSQFKIAEAINAINSQSLTRDRLNIAVMEDIHELVHDYCKELNLVLKNIGIHPDRGAQFWIKNLSRIFSQYNMKYRDNCMIDFGHGRASVTIKFSWQTNDMGIIELNQMECQIYQFWHKDIRSNRTYKVNSIAEIVNLSASVFKIFIYDQTIAHDEDRWELEKQLPYIEVEGGEDN